MDCTTVRSSTGGCSLNAKRCSSMDCDGCRKREVHSVDVEAMNSKSNSAGKNSLAQRMSKDVTRYRRVSACSPDAASLWGGGGSNLAGTKDCITKARAAMLTPQLIKARSSPVCSNHYLYRSRELISRKPIIDFLLTMRKIRRHATEIEHRLDLLPRHVGPDIPRHRVLRTLL